MKSFFVYNIHLNKLLQFFLRLTCLSIAQSRNFSILQIYILKAFILLLFNISAHIGKHGRKGLLLLSLIITNLSNIVWSICSRVGVLENADLFVLTEECNIWKTSEVLENADLFVLTENCNIWKTSSPIYYQTSVFIASM